MSLRKILALSGGVGGAKLALGLSKILAPEQLSIPANTADDFEHLGLPIRAKGFNGKPCCIAPRHPATPKMPVGGEFSSRNRSFPISGTTIAAMK